MSLSLTSEQMLRFEQFLMSDELQTRIKRIVRARYTRHGKGIRRNRHVYLDPEDLQAVAHGAAYEIFAKYDGRVPETELLPLTVCAVVRRLTNESIRAQRHGDADGIRHLVLDAPRGGVRPYLAGPAASGDDEELDGGEWINGMVSEKMTMLDSLIVREEVDALVGGLAPAEQALFKRAVEKAKVGGARRRGRPTKMEQAVRGFLSKSC